MNVIALHFFDLAFVWAAFALAIASPGPSNLAIMATSMSEGRVQGLALGVGVTAGSLTWGILTAVGVSALIAATPLALTVIKGIGALYMLFLAWRLGRSAFYNIDLVVAAAATPAPSLPLSFMRGYLIHLTNPKALLTWMAIMALGLKATMPTAAIVAMVIGCLMVSLSVNSCYALLFSTDTVVRGYRKVHRGVHIVLSAFFIFAAFKLATLH
jgi:threonine efflux protein